MSSSYELRLLTPDELPQIIPLLHLLDPGIDTSTLSERLEDMLASRYHCLGCFVDGELAGVSGFWILHKYYIGKHLEPDNVVIHPEFRNAGLGHRMMDWLEEHARGLDCSALELNCYVKNPDGLRFWRSRGYRTIGEHMRKDLGESSSDPVS